MSPRRNRANPSVRIVTISLRRHVFRRFSTIVRYGAVVAGAGAALYALTAFALLLRPHEASAAIECGVPVLAASAQHNTMPLSGKVTEAMLPWSTAPPEPLTTLWRLIGSDRLISAFRITLPAPLWDERQNIATAAAYVKGTVMEPGEVISAIGLTGPYTRQRGYGDGPAFSEGKTIAVVAGGICKLGSALYNVAIESGLTVVERQPHSMLVSYVPAGRDGAIATGSKDVRLRNDYDVPVLLWADVHDGTLFVAVYGDRDAPDVIWRHEQLSVRRAPSKRTPNSDLASGEERVVFAGFDGTTVRTSITVIYPGEKPIHRELSVDTYAPQPVVIEYGP